MNFDAYKESKKLLDKTFIVGLKLVKISFNLIILKVILLLNLFVKIKSTKESS